jgi:hypothetical protein
VRGVGSGDAPGVKRRAVVERTAGGVERNISAGQKAGAEAEVHAETEAALLKRRASGGRKADGDSEASARAEVPLSKRLPSLSGAKCRLRRAAQMPGIRRIGDAGGQQHRQVNRPKNQCYRESLSWGHVRKRKCNHL